MASRLPADFLPGRLRFSILSSPPSDDSEHHYFSIEDELVYEPFFADFGPLNLGQFVRFCGICDDKLADPKLSNRCIVFYSHQDPHQRTNAAVLIGMYAVARLGMEPHQAYAPFASMHNLLSPFRDASMGPSCFDLQVIDCLRATYKAMMLGWFDLSTFDLDRYEHYEQVENGDLQVIIPGKFVHCAGPAAQNHQTEEGWMLLGPESYVPIFEELGVRAVIRLNKKVYEKTKFIEAGIEHHDMYFTDGGCPSDEVVDKFIQVCEATYGAVAVHCKAGLGRTGTLTACYMMKHFQFTAAEAIAWLRICRPGSVIGGQQNFLFEVQERMQAQGHRYRQSQPNHLRPSLVTTRN